ncbi:MAG: phasin family protein [Rhodocyclaceae bacterium]|nr:phasin family protein [Rhodocyclaceae bacterium]MBX3670017.1 phasin family protein [Rhodocyclaceae bacterium]
MLGLVQANLESVLAMAKLGFAGAERLSALNLDAARAALDEASAGVRAALAAKDPQAVVALQQSLGRPGFEKSLAYARSVQEVFAQTQHEALRQVEEKRAEIAKSVAAVLENLAKSAPVGSEAAVAAVQQALAAGEAAYDNLNRAFKQVTTIAESNLAAVTQTMGNVPQAKPAKRPV